MMTGPNPDADLDEALGVTQLPPAAVTDAHREEGHHLVSELTVGGHSWDGAAEMMAQAIADAEQRGAARVLATQRAAGTSP